MKQNLLKIIATFTLLLGVFYACHDLSDSILSEENQAQAIENAKLWYEDNKPEVVSLKSTDNVREILMKPAWKNVYTQSDKQYIVVETEIMSNGRVAYLDKKSRELYKQTKDEKFNQSLTRLIFRTDKETGETTGFLMVIAPNADWLYESKFKPFKQMTYLKRNNKFGGQIIYYNLKGEFVNGWNYVNGEITGQITFSGKTERPVSLRSSSCTDYEYSTLWWECTFWYTQHESGDTLEGISNCFTYWEYDYTITICSGGGDGGYGGISGGTGSPIFSKNSLNTIGKDKLMMKLNKMIQECGYSYVYNQILSYGISFSDVKYDPNIPMGRYNSSTGELFFKNEDAIDQSFPEELIHLYQNELYCGIGREEGMINIEFEAKLIQDIFCYIQLQGCGYLGTGEEFGSEYAEWITEITRDGTYFPNFSDLLVSFKDLNYWDFMTDFKNREGWQYDGTIDHNLSPITINNISNDSGCN